MMRKPSADAGVGHSVTPPVVALGEILWDMLPAGPRLGGTTANFATACARLGRSATLISSLGADAWGQRAREVLAQIQQDGAALLNASLIQTATEVPTGLVEVSVGAGGQPSYRIAMPAAWDRMKAVPEAVAAVASAAAVCFGTLCQRSEGSRNTIRTLLESAPPGCARVLDVNVRMPFFSPEVARWSLAHATVAKISDEELSAVAEAVAVEGLAVSGDVANLDALKACGRRLLGASPGLELLAITLGPRGSLLLTHDGEHDHPGFPVKVVDTVGAGDAFTAGLVHAWLAGAPLDRVNEVGNLCGSFVASQAGATPVFPPALLARVQAAL